MYVFRDGTNNNNNKVLPVKHFYEKKVLFDFAREPSHCLQICRCQVGGDLL